METRRRDGILAVVTAVAVLLFGWFAYQPALSGPFLLDDVGNLGGLRNVDDSASALHFLLSGSAGPTGRPIALASFLPQAGSWKDGAAPFLTFNILLHLCNALLLAAFVYRLSLARGTPRADARYVALASMALWLFMPLLATATLMIVQRMTTLSATFMLLGLNGYLYARRSIERNPTAALTGMSVALVLATCLALLTKESGALLPVLVLVIEVTLLQPPDSLRTARWRAWASVFLVLPLVLIAGYLATRVPYSESLVLKKDFTGAERLLTESRILWEYLLNAFLPRPGEYGPYHDAHAVARSLFGPVTFLAVTSWLVVAVTALVRRREYPLLSFGVLWFLAGHLIESTTIPLELYFEHRNYIPIIGPVYALCQSLVLVPRRYRRVARIALPLYILVSAFFVFSLATLWGNPTMAARYWHERFPDSPRAASAMATQQLGTDGPQATLATLRDFIRTHPEHGYLGIPMLSLSCIIAPGEDHRREVREVARLLPRARFSYTAGTMLSDLVTATGQRPCNGVDDQQVKDLARQLSRNVRYESDRAYQQLHHQLMALMARNEADIEGTLDHLHAAIRLQPEARLNMMVVTTLASDGRFDDARAFIAETREQLPLHPLKRWLWQLELSELSTYLDENEKDSMNDGDNDGTGNFGGSNG